MCAVQQSRLKSHRDSLSTRTLTGRGRDSERGCSGEGLPRRYYDREAAACGHGVAAGLGLAPRQSRSNLKAPPRLHWQHDSVLAAISKSDQHTAGVVP
eukprot:769088-Rhodomonas_salina.2